MSKEEMIKKKLKKAENFRNEICENLDQECERYPDCRGCPYNDAYVIDNIEKGVPCAINYILANYHISKNIAWPSCAQHFRMDADRKTRVCVKTKRYLDPVYNDERVFNNLKYCPECGAPLKKDRCTK